ncbi:MAG TPA: SDR family oxidoreductase [Thermoanaerobaculia bacterium]|nr:SDR family oxidoreductase [Thermoanaerobaculia bacterium]
MSADMHGKVVVITGATSGIGQVAAERLATMGARIVQVARDPSRGEAALARLRAQAPGAAHAVHYADLLRLGEMKRVAAEIAAAEPRVDVLVNNAGAMFGSYELVEGLERTFALNHMSYFVLAEVLRDRLAAAAPARVVNTASDAHRAGSLDLDDLQSAKIYGGRGLARWLRYGGPGFEVYGRSKLCNILFTRELARRLAGTGVTANSLHPGFVATRFGDQSGGLLSLGIRIAKRFALSPEEGAKTLVHLASSPEVDGVTGEYFHRCRPAVPSQQARDDGLAGRLWTETARLYLPK